MNGRDGLLTAWAQYLADAARSGVLTGKACPISRIETIAGPRAGALEIFAGLESGRLLKVLSQNDAATLRQFVPWQFPGDPQVFMSGRYVRVEAGWPSGLADSVIRLTDCENYVSRRYATDGRWIAGKNEVGATVLPRLSDATPHFLICGTTGSGKSVALSCAILQLSQDPDNQIVLIDGKEGDGIKHLERLPGVVGPCAIDGSQIRGALGWTVAQMKERLASGEHDGRIILVVDEFQELTQDDAIVDMLRKICAQGRSAGVHGFLATQHPDVAAFGHKSIKRNLVGKIALHVGDVDASRVAVGASSPRADRLLGAGDAYAIAPGAVHRTQLAYIDESDITAGEIGGDSWRFTRWPDYDPENTGDMDERVNWKYTGQELAVSLVSSAHGEGRPTMEKRMIDAGLGKPGAEKSIRLLRIGRDQNEWLGDNGFAVCLSSDTHDDPTNVKIQPKVW